MVACGRMFLRPKLLPLDRGYIHPSLEETVREDMHVQGEEVDEGRSSNLCLPIAASCSSICHLSHGRLIPHAADLNLPYSSSPRLLERFSGCLADDREGRTRVSIIWKFLFKLVEYAYQVLEFIDIYHNFHYRLNIIWKFLSVFFVVSLRQSQHDHLNILL